MVSSIAVQEMLLFGHLPAAPDLETAEQASYINLKAICALLA